MSNLFTCFSMNDGECRVVQLKRQKNALKIDKFFTLVFDESIEQEAEKGIQQKAEQLKQALKERKCRIGECMLLIPKRYVTVRHAFLPSVEEGGYAIFHDVVGKKSILQPLMDKLLMEDWEHENQADSMLVLRRK